MKSSEEIDKLYAFAQKLCESGKSDMCLAIIPAHELFLTHPKLIDAAGHAAERLGKYELARDYYSQAREMFPNYPPPYLYGINVSHILWNDEESKIILDDALRRFPEDPFIVTANAEYLLRNGLYVEGWKCWDSRALIRDLRKKNADIPVWDGSPLEGRTLLLAGEQGVGDHIMFARYLKPLSTQGNVVCYLQIKGVMDRLLGSISSIPVYSKAQDLAKVDQIDCWTSIGSLPDLLNLPVPQGEVYIHPDATMVERTIRHFDFTDEYRVGLCWKGNPKNKHDHQRSVPFDVFAPLLDTPGCSFYSLQKDDRESGLVNLCNGDFYDTAAMIQNLDLVITVDTAVAHLAGAMGKEVWIMIGINHDWRWGTRGTPFSHWYQNDVLFWQESWNDWQTVIKRVKDRLVFRRKYETVGR